MKRSTRLGGLILLAACAVAACGPAASTPAATAGARADWPAKFVVGYFGGDDAETVLEDNEPIRLYYAQRLGLPVELYTGTSYTAVIEAMRADRVDAMLVGPFSYVLAVQEAGAEALAVLISTTADEPKYDPDLRPFYYSTIITKKGSGIRTIEDLRGKDFSFVDPASTSGHLAPKTLLLQRGLDPDVDMTTVFAGSHPTSVLSVVNDKVPAAATFEGNLERLQNEGQIEYCGFPDGRIGQARTQQEIDTVYEACPDGKIVIIAMSDPIPNTPFAVRSDLPDSFKAELKAALLDVKNHPELITAVKNWYVDPTQEMGLQSLDQFYNPLREIARLLDLNLEEMR
jgi:phosphonate transport system substrate-binding protein